MECVELSAPSHLHVGNIDLEGGIGRLYGTIGFTLRKPRLEARICKSSEPIITGSSRHDFSEIAYKIMELAQVNLRVEILREIPAHVGMGSTTPFVLGVGQAAFLLAGKNIELEELAVRLGRSMRSGLGFYSYKLGGFIVDGGFRVNSRRVPPLIFRSSLPGNLYIIYAIPRKPIPKIMEIKAREEEILSNLPPMPAELALENSRLVLMGILPAIAEGDWETAGRLLTQLNRGLGSYWAREQGDIYCCREIGELIDFYLDNQALCACQSSWGPTTYALVRGRRKALSLLERARRVLEDMNGGDIGITRIDNEGASIRVIK